MDLLSLTHCHIHTHYTPCAAHTQIHRTQEYENQTMKSEQKQFDRSYFRTVLPISNYKPSTLFPFILIFLSLAHLRAICTQQCCPTSNQPQNPCFIHRSNRYKDSYFFLFQIRFNHNNTHVQELLGFRGYTRIEFLKNCIFNTTNECTIDALMFKHLFLNFILVLKGVNIVLPSMFFNQLKSFQEKQTKSKSAGRKNYQNKNTRPTESIELAKTDLINSSQIILFSLRCWQSGCC